MTTIRGIAVEDTSPDEDDVYLEGDDTSLTLPLGSVKMTLKNAVENTTLGAQALRGDHSDEIHQLTLKALPVAADVSVIEDSAAGWAKKRVTNLALVGILSATKTSVRVATTANGTMATAFANGQTVNGVVLATNDRILIAAQTTASENGLYVVQASGAPVRADDMPAGAAAGGTLVVTREGTTNADSIYICTTNSGSDIVGTDNLAFTLYTTALPANIVATGYLKTDSAGTAANPSVRVATDTDGLYAADLTNPTMGISVEGGAAVLVKRVLDHASADEVALDVAYTVNKAAGDFRGLRISATETAVPANGYLIVARSGVAGNQDRMTLSTAGALVTAASLGTASVSMVESGDGAINYAAAKVGTGFTIAQATPSAGQTATAFTTRAGTGGAASGAAGRVGAAAAHYGGTGGAGDATYAAGAGAPITVQGGAAGANGGAGGAAGGNVNLDVGAGSGAGANGSVNIGTGTAPVAITLGGAATLVDVQGYLRLAEQSAPAAAANKGSLYVFDDGGDTEFCYADDDGNDVQLTRDGKPNTNCGVRALGTSTFSINGADDGVSCEWTGTSTGVAGTIDQGRAGQVTPITLTGTAGTITFAAGSGVTLEATRGKTLTTNAPAASTVVHVVVMYHSATFASVGGDLA